MSFALIVRPRRDDDLDMLVGVLTRQQPHSNYPVRWPPPYPVRDFIARRTERGAWVAEFEGRVVGHVSHTTVADDPSARCWTDPLGVRASELGCLSALFVEHDLHGLGIGGRLLDSAAAQIRAAGVTPVLDVVPSHSRAASVYTRRGWTTVSTGRPHWLPDDEPDVLYMALPEGVGTTRLTGVVVPGHQVASGRNPATPHPAGTIELQAPRFAARGLSLEGFEHATVNLDLGSRVKVERPTVTLVDVEWTDRHAPETFSFVRIRARVAGGAWQHGWVYHPHPETKPAHEQADSVLELLLPHVPGLRYGDPVEIESPARAVASSG